MTIHRTVAELDGGPIAAQEAFPLGELDAGEVYERCAEAAARLLERRSPRRAGRSRSSPQRASRTPRRSARPTASSTCPNPVDALRHVRALSPHIGAWAMLHERRVTVWRAHLEDGRFVPDEVQPEGRRRMGYDEFLRGLQ